LQVTGVASTLGVGVVLWLGAQAESATAPTKAVSIRIVFMASLSV
jgi:hypothetical protein